MGKLTLLNCILDVLHVPQSLVRRSLAVQRVDFDLQFCVDSGFAREVEPQIAQQSGRRVSASQQDVQRLIANADGVDFFMPSEFIEEDVAFAAVFGFIREGGGRGVLDFHRLPHPSVNSFVSVLDRLHGFSATARIQIVEDAEQALPNPLVHRFLKRLLELVSFLVTSQAIRPAASQKFRAGVHAELVEEILQIDRRAVRGNAREEFQDVRFELVDG